MEQWGCEAMKGRVSTVEIVQAYLKVYSAACTPGPAAYDVEDCYSSRFPSAPGVVIQGVRRPKRHDTGPFCAL